MNQAQHHHGSEYRSFNGKVGKEHKLIPPVHPGNLDPIAVFDIEPPAGDDGYTRLYSGDHLHPITGDTSGLNGFALSQVPVDYEDLAFFGPYIPGEQGGSGDLQYLPALAGNDPAFDKKPGFKGFVAVGDLGYDLDRPVGFVYRRIDVFYPAGKRFFRKASVTKVKG